MSLLSLKPSVASYSVLVKVHVLTVVLLTYLLVTLNLSASLCPIHSSLFPKYVSRAPSAQNTLSANICTAYFLTAFESLFRCHLLGEALWPSHLNYNLSALLPLSVLQLSAWTYPVCHAASSLSVSPLGDTLPAGRDSGPLCSSLSPLPLRQPGAEQTLNGGWMGEA